MAKQTWPLARMAGVPGPRSARLVYGWFAESFETHDLNRGYGAARRAALDFPHHYLALRVSALLDQAERLQLEHDALGGDIGQLALGMDHHVRVLGQLHTGRRCR